MIINESTAFNTPQASYNSSNAAYVLGLFDPYRSNIWYEMLYPKAIYLDKTETLTDAGYYVRFHGKFDNNYNSKQIYITANAIGDFRQYESGTSCSYVTPTSNDFNIGSVFGSYGYGAARNLTNVEYLGTHYNDFHGRNIDTSQSNYRRYFSQQFNLLNNGTQEYDLTLALAGNVTNTAIGYYTRYIPGGRVNNNSSTQSYDHLVYTGGEGGSVKQCPIDALTDENDRKVNGGGGPYFSLSANGGYSNTFSEWAVRDAATIVIHVYDKNGLNDAKTTLSNRYSELANSGLILSNLSEYNTLISSANTMLSTREVTSETIENKKNEINNFVFKISTPTSTWHWTYGEITAANALKQVYSGYVENYINVTVTGATTNPNNIFDAGTYNVTFTVKEPAKYKFASGSSSVTTVLTIRNANIIVGSTANQNSVFTGNPQYFSTPPSGVTTVNSMVPSYTYSTSDSGPWQSQVSFTDAGTHKVYFKVSANNHNDYVGNYNVVISKASISLTLQQINSTFGSSIPGSNALIDSSVVGAATGSVDGLLGVTEIAAIRNKLKDMVTFKVVDGTQTLTDNLTNAGSYTISYDYKDNWGDNVSIVFAASSNQSAYVISQKEISVTWKDKTSLKYDGAAGKRPDATIVSGDIVSGTTCTLNGV
ncbi:MAG: hypothetical protein K2M44_07120, partial [Clostridia bacterium]|nr:hypothetical protein [Clostridia bacterium]